jgi:hypothetical protein
MPIVAALPPEEVLLLERASAWRGDESLTSLTPARVGELARVHGNAFATALLYDRLSRRHAAANEIVLAGLDESAPHGAPLAVIVPGAFHRERMDTGADGRRLNSMLDSLGYRSSILATHSFGTLRENAQLLLDSLADTREEILLVALCKGASEIKVALEMPGAASVFSRVRGCVTLSGLWNGTPYANWMMRRRLRRLAIRAYFAFRGYRFSAMKEIEWGPGSPLDFDPPLPPEFRLVHVVGFPLEQHLTTPMAKRAYARLRSLGPSDGGGILLADAARFPGIVLPVWGADHYLRPSWDIAALIGGVLRLALSSGQLSSGQRVAASA